MSVTELDQLKADLAEAEAKEAALTAVLLNKPCPSEHLRDPYDLYKKLSATSRETQLNAITQNITTLNQRIFLQPPRTGGASIAPLYRVSVTLKGWRLKFGLRKMVTDAARSLGAFGSVQPVEENIVVDVWCAAKEAFQFIQYLEKLATTRFAVHWQPVEPEAGVPPDSLTFVPPYKSCAGSPDRDSSVTDSTVVQNVLNESAQHHRIFNRPISAFQQCHIVPQAILRKNITGSWMLVCADEWFNRLSDSVPHPIRIDAAVVNGDPRPDGRTAVKLTLHLDHLDDTEKQEMLKELVTGFERDELNNTVSVVIHEKEPELMVEACRWRSACIDQIPKQVTRVANGGATAWYLLESFDNFPMLRPFRAALPSKKTLQEETQAVVAADVDDQDDVGDQDF